MGMARDSNAIDGCVGFELQTPALNPDWCAQQRSNTNQMCHPDAALALSKKRSIQVRVLSRS
jgi:hypothetical protein